MANTYDAEAAAAAPDESDVAPDAGLPSTPIGGGKVSQEQANYRMGSPIRSCGLCQNFTGSDGSDPYQCTKVAGEISPFGFSDEYTQQDNPFIAGTQSTFDEGSETETPAEQAAPLEEPDPRVQIGNRSY